MPCHHAPHAPNVGPNLSARNENIAHVMPRVTARTVTSCAHRAARARRQAGRPKYTCQKLLMDVLFAQAELYTTKLTASHFKALSTKIANQNVLETILIAMAVSNENFRNCCGDPYRPCTTGRLHLASWGGVTSKISLVLVHFGLIKLKPKQNTIVFPTYFTC